LNAAYVNVAIERWQRFIGEKVILAATGKSFSALKSQRLTE
jgi:hypothetical protein